MKVIQRQVVLTEVEISHSDARALIVEARINVPGKLDAYEKSATSGYIQRIFTLDVDDKWKGSGDELLEYAREYMPGGLTFGR